MVVLAIAALVLTITPPLFTAAVPGVELKASARRVMAGLRLARELAIRNDRDIAFTLDVEARTFEVDDESRNGRLGEDLELKLEVAETEQLGEYRGAVCFFPDGSSSGGRIILAREDRGYQVGVQWLTGRVLMASWRAERRAARARHRGLPAAVVPRAASRCWRSWLPLRSSRSPWDS